MASREDPEQVKAQSRIQDREGTSFEETYNRLNETVQALESGGLTLDAATNLYEEGMALVRLCNELLVTAELKITQLKDVYADDLRRRPVEEAE